MAIRAVNDAITASVIAKAVSSWVWAQSHFATANPVPDADLMAVAAAQPTTKATANVIVMCDDDALHAPDPCGISLCK